MMTPKRDYKRAYQLVRFMAGGDFVPSDDIQKVSALSLKNAMISYANRSASDPLQEKFVWRCGMADYDNIDNKYVRHPL